MKTVEKVTCTVCFRVFAGWRPAGHTHLLPRKHRMNGKFGSVCPGQNLPGVPLVRPS